MPSRRGFSLIELLVTLVITGLLATVILQFLQAQGRFARLQGAREEVQQNARALVDIISSELRGVATGGLAGPLDANSLSFFSPRAWGASCGDVGGSTGVSFPAGQSLPAIGSNLQIARPGETSPAPTTDQSAGALAAIAAACNAVLGSIPAATEAEVRRYGGIALQPFERVYLYETVTYSIGTVNGRSWILRNGQPFAGPVASSPDGLRFTYLDGNGNVTANAGAVSRLRIDVRTESRGRFNARPQETNAATVVSLRNRL